MMKVFKTTGFTAVALTTLLLLSNGTQAQTTGPRWIGAWGASPSGTLGSASYQGFTVRQTVHPSISGNQYRVRLSNDASAQPITIGPVLASMSGTTPGSINAGVSLPVLFGGQSTITIPANGSVLSDPVPGYVFAQSDFTVGFYVAAESVGPTDHTYGQSTVYVAQGNQVASPQLTGAVSITARPILAELDILQPAAAGTIVTLGDSITDGYGSTVDANHRWPDTLATRLQQNTAVPLLGVVNAGIGGNQLTRDGFGASALARLARDVLAVPNLRYVTVLIGINDIGFSASLQIPLQASDLIQGYKQIIAKMHERNVKVLIGTVMPVGGSAAFSPFEETIRAQVNTWIRAGQGFDGVLDFDAVVRNPSAPGQLLSGYDSGDHVHPNDAGYAAMANAIDLSLFAQ